MVKVSLLPLVLSSTVGTLVCALGVGHLARAISGMGTLLHNGGMGGCCMAKGGLPKAVMCPISTSGQDAPKRSNFSARSSAAFFLALSLT